VIGDAKMRRNPYLFSPDEYKFLHQVFLKEKEQGKMAEKIRKKKGVGLDKSEIKLVKRRFENWNTAIGNDKYFERR